MALVSFVDVADVSLWGQDRNNSSRRKKKGKSAFYATSAAAYGCPNISAMVYNYHSTHKAYAMFESSESSESCPQDAGRRHQR